VAPRFPGEFCAIRRAFAIANGAFLRGQSWLHCMARRGAPLKVKGISAEIDFAIMAPSVM